MYRLVDLEEANDRHQIFRHIPPLTLTHEALCFFFLIQINTWVNDLLID